MYNGTLYSVGAPGPCGQPCLISWSDRWMHGCSLEDITTAVFNTVPLRLRQWRTVAQGMQYHSPQREEAEGTGWRVEGVVRHAGEGAMQLSVKEEEGAKEIERHAGDGKNDSSEHGG